MAEGDFIKEIRDDARNREELTHLYNNEQNKLFELLTALVHKIVDENQQLRDEIRHHRNRETDFLVQVLENKLDALVRSKNDCKCKGSCEVTNESVTL